MAAAVGRTVVTLKLSARADWEPAAAVRVALPQQQRPSTSGRAVAVRGGQRWRGPRAARSEEQLVVEKKFVSSNALDVVGTEESGAAAAADLLAEFEGLLTKQSQEVARLNEGSSTIFLVGMMASGKSTVGRVLADALGYSFFDSDEVIESYVGGLPVKEIFRQKSETAFRDLETRALRELSGATSLVVATGGGAVLRDENWEYLRDGITVWLDVPVEDLARRVTTVGTESRPLLGGDCCDFEKAFLKLSNIMNARQQHYARAHCRLSFQDLASQLQLTGVAALTPTAIAVQVLVEITRVFEESIYIPPPSAY